MKKNIESPKTVKKKIISLSLLLIGIFSVIFFTVFIINFSLKVQKEYNYIINLTKKQNQDFTILNIGDIQFCDSDKETLKEEAKQIIKDGINKYHPDLITLTGDQTWTNNSISSFHEIVEFMESLNILWAPVMGNHEREGIPVEEKANIYQQAKNCLFLKGINEDAYGDYIIKIKENDKLKYALFMMDTHNYKQYENISYGYGEIELNQQKWYQSNILKLKEENNEVVSLLFMHIPLIEYQDAYNLWEANDFSLSMGIGEKQEPICPGIINHNFFDLIKTHQSTKYIFCGHDHSNNFSILYQGIKLTYVMKTGSGCNYEGKKGYTIIKLGHSVEIIQEVAN